MAGKEIKGLVLGFIAIILGITFLMAIADSERGITQTFSETNESFAGVNATGVELAEDLVAVSELRNSSHIAVEATNYTYSASADTVTVYQGTGTYYADYTFHAENYVAQGATRTLVTLIVLFFAIGVLAFAMGSARVKEWIDNFGG